MEQHPVPQQISSYQFRLVGDMTLKQFLEVAAGVLVGIILYAAPIHPFIKWPLIILSVAAGGALAFIPFEERPLEKWVFAFFRSVYSPTLFYWKKQDVQIEYFQKEETGQEYQTLQHVPPQNVEVVEAVPDQEGSVDQLEGTEKAFLNQVTDLLSTGTLPPLPSTPAKDIKIQSPRPQIQVPPTTPANIKTTTNGINDSAEKTNHDIKASDDVVVSQVQAPLQSSNQIPGTSPHFSPDAAPPYPPTVPNTIAGQTLDETGKIVEGVILEIKDEKGRPVRALRTNRLGHFLTVTPLINGKYQIITEKDGFHFDPIDFEAKGELIPPFAIRAQKPQVGGQIYQTA